MAVKLYVGNLPFKTGEDDLRSMFQKAGTVESVNIVSDKFSGKSRGFGFVEMASAEDAEKAVGMLNGQTLEGRAIVVNEARPQVTRDRGGRQGAY